MKRKEVNMIGLELLLLKVEQEVMVDFLKEDLEISLEIFLATCLVEDLLVVKVPTDL